MNLWIGVTKKSQRLPNQTTGGVLFVLLYSTTPEPESGTQARGDRKRLADEKCGRRCTHACTRVPIQCIQRAACGCMRSSRGFPTTCDHCKDIKESLFIVLICPPHLGICRKKRGERTRGADKGRGAEQTWIHFRKRTMKYCPSGCHPTWPPSRLNLSVIANASRESWLWWQ